jgi:hypothetical protein
MFKIRFLLVMVAVLALVALPLSSATAQGPYYYCSATRTSGGSGTYYDPWACSTEAQMTTVTNTVCRLGGGTLYQIHTGSYVVFTIRWTGNMCEMTVGEQRPGYPPNTGVDLPAPLVYGGVAFAGIALLAGGLLLRRKHTAA